MSDTISRQAAIDVIANQSTMSPHDRVIAVDTLVTLPPAEPEIIRCKDCKHWFDIDGGRQLHKMCADICGDWFCADAERKEYSKERMMRIAEEGESDET